MNISFYIFGITDLQDMFPYIIETINNKDYKCKIEFFDCFREKRQFYYYENIELLSLFPDQKVTIYRQKDKNIFKKKYNMNPPDVVFTKHINPKHVLWFPQLKKSKIVYFSYMRENHHLKNSKVKVDLTLVNDKRWAKYYKDYNFLLTTDYRIQNLAYVNKENYSNKRCFIVESWIRNIKSNLINDESKFYNRLIKDLKKEGYEIVWKKREKGYPKVRWASPLDICDEKPDVIIEKDNMLPSSLYYYAYNSDICLFINDCFAFFDTIKINKNSFIIKSPLYKERKYKFDQGWFDDFKNNILEYDDFFMNKENIIEQIGKIEYNMPKLQIKNIINILF
jgi:hypothetical protein